MRIARYRHDRERGVLRGAVGDLELAAETIPQDHPIHARVVADLGAARTLYSIDETMGPNGPAPTLSASAREGLDQAMAAAASIGTDHPDFPALTAQSAIGLVLKALADHDIRPLDQAISLFAAASSVPALTLRERPGLLQAHGAALLQRFMMTRDARDLSNAIDRLEEARRAVEQQEGSPNAGSVLETLAAAYRARDDPSRGDTDRAVTIGLAALREHVGDVLLQSSDEDALRAGRGGADDAVTMARWFLEHQRPGPAVSAIELGRGIVLYAATAVAGLADVLREAGHQALASEWANQLPEHGTDEAVSDLRYRIMLAIEGSAVEARALPASCRGDPRRARARRGRCPGLPVSARRGRPRSRGTDRRGGHGHERSAARVAYRAREPCHRLRAGAASGRPGGPDASPWRGPAEVAGRAR